MQARSPVDEEERVSEAHVSFFLRREAFNGLESLVDDGEYANRSEALRDAVEKLLEEQEQEKDEEVTE